MARQTEVDIAALKFASVIHDYARSHKWNPDEYAIFMYVNYDFVALHIAILARVFEHALAAQMSDHYHNIRARINAGIKREDNPFNYYGLVLDPFEPPSEWADKFVFTPAEEIVDEALINEGRTWSLHEPARPVIRFSGSAVKVVLRPAKCS